MIFRALGVPLLGEAESLGESPGRGEPINTPRPAPPFVRSWDA